jgi:hypothetical protein
MNFNRSRLVRSLSGLSPVDVAPSSLSFAERLAQCLSVSDAIALFAALSPGAVRAATVRSGAASAVEAEFARVQRALTDSIVGSEGGRARIAFPTPAADASAEALGDFLPYRRYYQAQQREMAARITPLRAATREALAKGSPVLKQLAAVDAAFDQALGERERDALAAVPLLLERHFDQLRKEQASIETQPTDHQPGGWLARFGRDLQDLLLAELELRLLPVMGLIEAYRSEIVSSNE